MSRFTDPAYLAGYKRGHDVGSRCSKDGRGIIAVAPCQACGAADARDPAHARGCPALEPLTRDQLVALARAVEAGWAARREKTRSASA